MSTSQPFDFKAWWAKQPKADRDQMARNAGTSDEYITKFLLTGQKVPRIALVRRLSYQMPKDSGITAEMLRDFFYPVK